MPDGRLLTETDGPFVKQQLSIRVYGSAVA
jgi:hypothetical protein